MKMLIVDDHPIERKTISYLVNNTDYNIETITKANGIQALEYLKNNKVDLLFTDIKMPFMDGLTLIEHALKLHSNMKVIIFSGYGEFDYAKRAISMGVNDYLLKPLVKSEFYECLNNVVTEINKVNKIEHYAAEKIITDIIYDRYSANNQLHKTIFSEIWGDSARYALVLVKNGIPLSDEQFVMAKVILNVMFPVVVPISEDEYLLVIVNEGYEKTDNDLVVRLSEYIMKNFIPEFKTATVILSPFFTDITDCKEQYNNIQLIQSSSSTINLITIDKPIVPFSDTDFTISYTTLIKWFFASNIKYLESSDIGRSKQILIFCINLLNTMPNIICENLLQEFINLIYACHFFDDSIAKSISNAILGSDDAQKVTDFAIKSILNINNQKDVNEINKNSLNSIKAYIRRNLHADLSLSNLANMVSYTPNYLCGLFSSNMNMTITQYVTQQRMEKAKTLLTSTNMKVKEISQKVGYSNSSYFNRIFKNYTGSTPKEYKGYV